MMQNPSGPGQSGQEIMFYYMTVPNGAGQTYGPGGEGQGQGPPFDAQQGFPNGPPVYYTDQDQMGGASAMGMMPIGGMQPGLVPWQQGGNMGGQMMILNMPIGHNQQPQGDNNPNVGQAAGGWQPPMQGAQAQGTAQGAAPQRTESTSSAATRAAAREKAFKIVNPNTKEEVQIAGGGVGVAGGKGDEIETGGAGTFGPGGGGGRGGMGMGMGHAQGGRGGGKGFDGGDGSGMGNPAMQQAPQQWVPQQGGFVGQPNMPNMPNMQQPYMPMPNAGVVPGVVPGMQHAMQQPKVADMAPSPAAAATSKKKTLNKKLEKPVAKATPDGEGTLSPECSPTEKAHGTATAKSPTAVSEKEPANSVSERDGEGAEKTDRAHGVREMPPLGPRAAAFLAQPSNSPPHFASSIKALNLEPLRTSTAPSRQKQPFAQAPDLMLPHGKTKASALSAPSPTSGSEAATPAARGDWSPGVRGDGQQTTAPPAPAPVQPPQQQQQPMPQQQQPQQQQAMLPQNQQQMAMPPMQPQAVLPMMPQVNPMMQPPNPHMMHQMMHTQMQQAYQQQQLQQQQAATRVGVPTGYPTGSVVPPQAVVAPASTATVPKKKLKNVAMHKPGQEPSKTKEETPRPEGSQAEATSPHAAEETVVSVATPARKALSLRPEDGIFDRTLMLRIWRTNPKDVHPALQGLKTKASTGERPRDPPKPIDKSKKPPTTSRGKDHQSLKPSEGGYQIREAGTRNEKLEREVRSLLNKICPDNLRTIVERLALIDIYTADELDFVIRIIFSKALNEPHYCETYADMVFALRTRYPEFPAEEGEKPVTFTRVLLNTCQNEFESLPTITFEPTEEEKEEKAEVLMLQMKRRKDRMLANMKFIGNLFLRQLLAVKVVGQVVHDLVGIRESGALPEEHMIECVCELLQAIGHTLDGTQNGKMLMQQFASRLTDLKQSKVDGKAFFSKRIQFQIQDLLDLRGNNWKKKLFKELAKSKDEVRSDAIKESKGKSTEVVFQTTTAGVRPGYIDELKIVKGAKAKDETGKKPDWNQAYVRKAYQYYSDEKNGTQLHKDWTKAQPTAADCTKGVHWLCEIGFNDVQKEDSVADCVVELLKRQAVTWSNLADAIQPMVDQLEDMKIDVPKCDVFFHSLLSKLLLSMEAVPFNSIILKQIPLGTAAASRHGNEFVWGLLIGSLNKVKKVGGDPAVRKALEVKEFKEFLCKAKNCSPGEVNWKVTDALR